MQTQTIEGSAVRDADDPASNPVAEKRTQVNVRKDATPMEMIAAALKAGVDTEQLSALMTLQERYEGGLARKAFAEDFAAFKREPIEIIKNKHVSFKTEKGTTEYNHATLHKVCEQIIEKLGHHNIAHAWRTKNEGGKVIVTTVLRHTSGHEEEVVLEGAPDSSGGKNGIQAVGSTITYLQRYGLLAITGLAVKGQDDDGRGAGSIEGGMPATQRADFEAAVDGCSSAEQVSATWANIVKACEKVKDWEAYGALKQRCSERKAALKVPK